MFQEFRVYDLRFRGESCGEWGGSVGIISLRCIESLCVDGCGHLLP